jgi:hypothetical protein
MNLGIKFKERVKALVNDPVFDKPIQNKDYSKKGFIKLVTKIKCEKKQNHN